MLAQQNVETLNEAAPRTIVASCPYCLVMLGDAISAKKSSGEASESLEIVDVATLLARSVAPAAPAAGPVPAAEPTPAAEPASAGEPVEPTSAAEPAPPAGPVPPAADG
jgi:outer membrane biosynthesis protein TonB